MKKTFVLPFIAAFLCLLPAALTAQKQNPEVRRKVDSLEHILNTHKLTPIEQVYLLDSINWLVRDDLEKNILYLGKELEIIEKEKINDKNKIHFLLSTLGMCNMLKGNHDLAFLYLNKALQSARALNDTAAEIRMLTNLGNTHALQGKYALALDYYLQALSLCEKWKINDSFKSRVLGNIAEIYYMMGNQSQALAYAERFFETNPGEGANYLRAQVYYIIASVYLDRGELDKAEKNALKSFQCVENENLIYECFSMEALASVYLQRGNYNKALEYADKSLYYAGELDDPALYVKAYNVLSIIYLEQKQYDKSEAAALKAMELNLHALDTEPRLAYTIASVNIHRGNKEKAEFFLHKYDEITKRNTDKNFHETLTSMEIQHKVGEKEIRIASLEKEKRLHVWLGIAGVVILLTISGLFLFRNRMNRQKHKIAEQQIKQLEQEKQLVATQSVLDGETSERKRLAKDLHDGLGGMLSAVRISLDNFEHLQHARELLDRSIDELRRVAHHLMPASLLRLGLKASLEDFCLSVPNTHFHYYGEDKRLDEKTEILIYRCVYELVNNAVKHSGAENINIQLLQDANRISLTVQDDGCGFDPETINEGMGIENIRTRIASFNGKINIYSTQGKGTEVYVEIILF
ncbi:MAG: tetratricopeptide repeat protein [Candidatus Symbiothrix sp.]|jgi:signal transduction histidine kinase|nr:tetratricopeptide repeat protein [Candidatus Symbiothrix sp.]